jgi:periplasmic protein TonB
MFEQTFVREGQTKKPVTVMLAVVIQIVVITVLAIVPMIWFDVLPAAQLSSTLVAPPPPPPPPPPDPAPVVKVVKVIPRQFDEGILTAPKMIPKRVALINEDELPPASSAVGVVGSLGGSGDVMGSVLGSIVGAGPSVAPPPPPQPKRIDITPPRINVGGKVQSAKLIRQPRPVYPPLARQARISGVVRLSAVISRNGTIQELQVVSGHPLLVPAALEAVKQWVYQPTLLNGETVEVQTQIDVNFTLSQY